MFFVLFFQDIWKLMIHPGEFFEEIKDEPGIKKPFLYLLTSITISLLITLPIKLGFNSIMLIIFLSSIGGALISLLLIYPALVGMFYFLILLFRPHHDVYYIDTYKVYGYVSSWLILLGTIIRLIPTGTGSMILEPNYFLIAISVILDLALGVYSFMLLVMGLSRVHEISEGKVILVILLPIILFFILIAIETVLIFFGRNLIQSSLMNMQPAQMGTFPLSPGTM